MRPPLEPARVPVLFQLQTLENALPGVIVRGIPTVERAVINKKQGGGFNLLVEGTNLAVRRRMGWCFGARKGGMVDQRRHLVGLAVSRCGSHQALLACPG